MKSFDKEDKILLVITIFLLLVNMAIIITGSQIYQGSWPDWYIIITISAVIFFIFSLLSLVVKKYNERKKK